MWRVKGFGRCGLLLLSMCLCIQSVPVKTKVTPTMDPKNVDSGLHYDRYLKEVLHFLEKDKNFRAKLHTLNMDELKKGTIAKELDFVNHNVRTKLDELKRQEVARLRMLLKAKHDLVEGNEHAIDYQALLKQFEYLNHDNHQTFDVADLDRLIKSATNDLKNYDKKHHEEFKKYEMMKEHERREHLKTLDAEHRKKVEEHQKELKKKHADHPKLHHPGSKDQLKEVWKETDGLDPDDFDPKTFFKLHDANGDGFFDESELEALFTKELEKVYNPNNEEDDMFEMEEERLRMREHVMEQVDTDKDQLVSLEEFLKASQNKEFLVTDPWETLEQMQHYTEEELKSFEEHVADEEKALKKKVYELETLKEDLQLRMQELDLDRVELQKALKTMEKKRAEKAAEPSRPPMEQLDPSYQKQDTPPRPLYASP